MGFSSLGLLFVVCVRINSVVGSSIHLFDMFLTDRKRALLALNFFAK